MVRRLLFGAVVMAALTLGGQSARAGDFAIGGGLSTLGIGIHGAAEINDFLALRLNANYGSIDLSGNYGGISYDNEITLLSAGLLLDVYPFGISPVGGGFVISGGAYYNANEMEFVATPTGTIDVGGTNFSVGSLRTDVEFNELAPFIAIGWDGSFHSIVPMSFFVRAGVLFQGAPDVTLTATGGAIPSSNLRREEQQIADDLGIFEFYPVLEVGIIVRF